MDKGKSAHCTPKYEAHNSMNPAIVNIMQLTSPTENKRIKMMNWSSKHNFGVSIIFINEKRMQEQNRQFKNLTHFRLKFVLSKYRLYTLHLHQHNNEDNQPLQTPTINQKSRKD